MKMKPSPADVMATQSSAILLILVNHCGQLLSPDNVDKIHAEIINEMRTGPMSWAFSPERRET